MSKRKPKKFDVVGTGYVPANRYRWKDAGLVFFRPGYGMVSVSFLGCTDDEFTIEVLESSCRKVVNIGIDHAEGWSGSGIGFWAEGVKDLVLKKSDFPDGDIRDMMEKALESIRWPTDMKKYMFVARFGKFWGRPLPSCGDPDKDKLKEMEATPARLKSMRDEFGERVNAIEAKVS